MKKRCDWCGDKTIYIDYHDKEWGVPIYDNQRLFEFLILEGMQAGLSWLTILNKRDNFRQAFAEFDPEKMARFNKRKFEALMRDEGIIRNRLKINSAIGNAKAFLKCEETGDFSEFVWEFVDGQPIVNRFKKMSDVPAKTDRSDQMAKTLKKLGFNFVGSTICYAFMQAVGMVNDHLISCYRYQELK